MSRCWSPVYDEEENYLPYDDFDPLKEWLVYPDCLQLQNPSDLNNTSIDSDELNYSKVKREQKDQIVESSIDVKMEKVSLLEISDSEHREVGLEENEGESDGGMKSVKLGLEDLKSNQPNKEGITEGGSDEEGSKSVQVLSDNGDSSSDEPTSGDESSSIDDFISDESTSVSLSSSEDEDVGMKRKGEAEEFEEGEVMEFDAHEIDFLCDDEEEGPKGPIRSKHELEDLPPVPKVEVMLQPDHQLLPVGVISSIMSNRVIVEGSVLHNPLNEGSILWVTDTRLPLGLVDEIFGPVKNPYYVVRYNTEEVPTGISVGIAVSFVAEFASQILHDKDLYRKGYDASGENDEEVDNEGEFSDDEKEAEHKKSLREGKRAIDQGKGAKQELRFERKRNTIMGPRAQHKDAQKQPNYPSLVPPQPSLCRVQSGSWSSLSPATNAGSVPSPTMPQFSHPIQAVNSLGNPSQQYSTQQHQDAPWLPGFSPQLQNTGLQGELPMQLQNQNVILNNLVNMMAFQQLLQLLPPHQCSTLPWAGAAPSLQPLGQNNFAPPSFNHGFMNVPGRSDLGNEQIQGQASLPLRPSMQFNAGSSTMHFNGGKPGKPALGNEQIQGQASLPLRPSMQFNAGSSTPLHFNGGKSWSRGRRPYQRGGGRFFDRGGRQP